MASFFDFCCGGADTRDRGGSEDAKAFHGEDAVDHDAYDGAESGDASAKASGGGSAGGGAAAAALDKKRYDKIYAEEEALLLQMHAEEEQRRRQTADAVEERLRREEMRLLEQKAELGKREDHLRSEEVPRKGSERSSSTDSFKDAGTADLEACTRESDDESVLSVPQDNSLRTATDYLQAGVESCYRKDYALSKRQLKTSVRLAIQEDDETLLARACGNLANVYESVGRSAKALRLYKSSIALLRQAGDSTRERFVISNALFSFVRLKRYREALRMATRQQEILREQEAEDPSNAEIRQSRRDAGDVVQVLENAILHGHEVVFDLDPANRVLFAVREAS